MPGSIKDEGHTVLRDPGHALAGDQIIIQCRKPSDWKTVRASEEHNYFVATARKNAYAVLSRRFTNVKEVS